MKDHFAIVDRRFKLIEEDQRRLEGENRSLRSHGRVLVDYLSLLAEGKTAPDSRANDIQAALKAFGRYSRGSGQEAKHD